MMADPKGKIETELEIKTSAEKFYKFKRETPDQARNIASDNVVGVELDEGQDRDSYGQGSVKTLKYTIDGVYEELKERIEYDDEKKMVSHVALEGDLFKKYKSFVIMYRFVPKSEGSLVKLSIEYEQLNPDVPAPSNYLNLIAGFIKDIDAYLGEKP